MPYKLTGSITFLSLKRHFLSCNAKKHQKQPKMADYFFLVIKDMFKSLSLSPTPLTPCHTEQTTPSIPLHPHIVENVECDQMPDSFLIFSYP